MLAEAALLCLSLNVYFEARGEPILGQYAVAQVTMNRAAGNPNRVCLEVFKPHQFSWTTSRAEKVKGGYRLIKGNAPRDMNAWATAVTVARTVLSGGMKVDVTHGATYYHAEQVHPAWRKHYKQTVTIGKHLFYAMR